MSITSQVEAVSTGVYDTLFSRLYPGEDPIFHRKRWNELLNSHNKRVGDDYPRLFSAPGRTELSGNHTDHNRGCVLAASVQLDTIAAVSQSSGADSNTVVIISEGYKPVSVDLADLTKIPAESGNTTALVRGIAAGIVESGGRVGGFNATTTSRVLGGSGLSSSAALEVLVGSIFNELFNKGRFSPVELAKIGQYAENEYFDKPCGLMDQVACANGGAVAIDFSDPSSPAVEAVNADFHAAGFTLAVVDSGGNHADLTADYAAIPGEMRQVAEELGFEVLRETDEQAFLAALPDIRKKTGDRALLRALHFYSENRRVSAMVEALKSADIDGYLEGVRGSGDSSYRFLQNVFSPHHVNDQAVSLALALTERFLGTQGACRVHGGGFAGTIQVFIPNERFDSYRKYMEPFFGENCVVKLSIRPLPVGELKIGEPLPS